MITALRVAADRQALPADGRSLAYITADTVDENGNWNRWGKTDISVRVEGAAELLGFGSAAPSGGGSYQDTQCTTWDGRVMAVIRSTEAGGPIKVHFAAEGCQEKVVAFNR